MPEMIHSNWSAFSKIIHSLLPRNTARLYVSRHKHWAKHKGSAWVLDRQKAVYDIAKLLEVGRVRSAISVARENDILVDSNGIPKGVEGHAVRLFCLSKKPTVKRRAIAVLRSYTGIVFPELTKKQWNKAKQSITAKPFHKWFQINPMDMELKPFAASIIPDRWKLKGKLKLAPLRKLSGTSSYPTLGPNIKDLRSRPYGKLVQSLLTKGIVPPSLLEYYDEDSLLRMSAENYQRSIEETPTYGKVVALQERGGKARVICSPNAWVQWFMYPLHEYLFEIIQYEESRRNPYYGYSCVLDQQKGVYKSLEQISSSGFAASVDLSSATDRFPLHIQTALLSHIGLNAYAEAFCELKGPYMGPHGESLTYETGQPMGVYGSFPLFHLSHLVLLRTLCRRLRLDHRVAHFCVLGDDVIFYNQSLHDEYRSVLSEQLAVQVSESKSYSGNLAEFAGFLLLRNPGGKPTAFRPYKWGKGYEITDVINIIHAVGSPITKWGKKWARYFELYQSTLGSRSLDLSPLVGEVDKDPVSTNRVSESYLNSLDNYIREELDLPPAFGIPLIYTVEYEADSHVSQSYMESPKSSEDFNPDLYMKDEILAQRRDPLRARFVSDPLVKERLGGT